jgi:2-dehydro-3-deoxygluconokinase
MGNIWAADKLLGVTVMPDIHKSGQKEIYLQEALNSSEEVARQFPKCKAVANTFRFDKGSSIQYYTTLYTGKKLYHSAEYNAEFVTDKVGSGDCFMAGLIYGFYRCLDPSKILDFATAAAFEKLFIAGDATKSTVEEINNAIKYER